MLRLRVLLVVSAVVAGCAPAPGDRVMSETKHSHYHVHGPGIGHGHVHADFTTGGHTHEHDGHEADAADRPDPR